MDNLQTMLDMQRQLQITGIGIDPKELEGEDRINFSKDMILALLDEVHEVLNEMGWKPWATSRHFNEELVQKELIDAWHFFMNLLLAAGVDGQKLFELYTDKNRENLDRWQRGYTGTDK